MSDHLEDVRDICYKHFGHEWEVTEADIFYDIVSLLKRVEDNAKAEVDDSDKAEAYRIAWASGFAEALERAAKKVLLCGIAIRALKEKR